MKVGITFVEYIDVCVCVCVCASIETYRFPSSGFPVVPKH